MESKILATYPSVFVVGEEYHICALVDKECTMWVTIGDRTFYDHSNGILRSGRFLHKVIVSQQVLDSVGEYTVHCREIVERKPYYTECAEVESSSYAFRPVRGPEIHIINLADSHNLVKEPIACGSYFGDKLDLLILNGDIPNHSGKLEYFKAIYQIAGGITKGQAPCLFSRGNHDTRGIYAENIEEYTPTDHGKSYFTFKLGDVWGLVLDCGEDKPDENPEYGHTICCHAFREEETAFIDEVIAKGEYKDAKYRLIVCHHPFTYEVYPPFNIEQDLYASWAKKLKAIDPTVMLCGHIHTCIFDEPGGYYDSLGQPCKLLCSSYVRDGGEGNSLHVCGALTIKEGEMEAKFISSDGREIEPFYKMPNNKLFNAAGEELDSDLRVIPDSAAQQ
ncbi:MAG: metallophosphoesterase [Clostridiales bacterium]|nr:metallophosphoesterase [Clostridiales bacterium]